ncbi:MAG: acylase [Sphingomonadales bacterium]|nr:MAG: acylase [Sphingomonadales bacterium]
MASVRKYAVSERLRRTIACALAAGFALSMPALAAGPEAEARRLREIAARTEIARDNWGIPHVHGRSDADAVFAMMYAQAEDDFPRIEANFLTSLGRTAEVEGEEAIWRDLRQRLFVDPERLRALYAESPAWLQALMTGWADGLNYYLLTHPQVKPRLITRFEPWMALSFTEGSIGGDISKISPARLEAFYGKGRASVPVIASLAYVEPTGSNGAAIAPANSANGRALLLINPHTSFYFRSEAQVTSDAGLNVYGASTWGQFFVYQGFNANAGWMHTTSSADAVDEFVEQVSERGGKLHYRYGQEWRPLTSENVTLRYRKADGSLGERTIETFRTHRGPIVRAEGGKWISVALMNRPLAALEQSFLRTKATDLDNFIEISRRAANSSNDTLFADRKGQIALLMPQFLPKRDDRFDYTKPVDGSDPATDWQGDTPLEGLPQVVRPASGWAYNSNEGPWWASGANSPKRGDFPRYVDQVGDNARTPSAVRAFGQKRDFTLGTLIEAAYDPRMPVFERLIPQLVADYDALPAASPQRQALAEPIASLRKWDHRWSATSIDITLAVFWGETLWETVAADARAAGIKVYEQMALAAPEARLAALERAIARLNADFGTWRTSWGEYNRFQRLDGAIQQRYDDSKPSVPIPFGSSQWGSLASFGARRGEGTKRQYGWTGNSFVAVVEFGERVRARAIVAGGQSGDPASPHFTDQVARYAGADFRDVYFYPEDVRRHTVRRYRPGER